MNCGEIRGFDISDEAIKHASSKWPGVAFFKHDIYVPLKQKYDLITCTETLEHLTDPELALSNLASALEPKGVLVMTVPDGRFDRSRRHVHFWSPESWAIFLKKFAPQGWYVKTSVIQHPEVSSLRYNLGLVGSSIC